MNQSTLKRQRKMSLGFTQGQNTGMEIRSAYELQPVSIGRARGLQVLPGMRGTNRESIQPERAATSERDVRLDAGAEPADDRGAGR